MLGGGHRWGGGAKLKERECCHSTIPYPPPCPLPPNPPHPPCGFVGREGSDNHLPPTHSQQPVVEVLYSPPTTTTTTCCGYSSSQTKPAPPPPPPTGSLPSLSLSLLLCSRQKFYALIQLEWGGGGRKHPVTRLLGRVHNEVSSPYVRPVYV